jgi:hypothetical protein
MNGEYEISNANLDAEQAWDSSYSSYKDVEYFEVWLSYCSPSSPQVYSPPITSRYADVYWRMMSPVPLEPALVTRFRGKTMAIVGYETNQVFVHEGRPDKSVPITHAYNHHYIAYMSAAMSELRKVEGQGTPSMDGGLNHGAHAHYHTHMREDIDDPTPDSEVPTSQFISEGNGGEFRKSFHGYPKGFAQLIESPTAFHIQPMQIDTWNREYNGSDFRAGPLPRESRAPPGASYSGLMECPCTDRIEKKVEQSYATKSSGTCTTSDPWNYLLPVTNATECFTAASEVQEGKVNANKTVSSGILPQYCTLVMYRNGTTIAYYNAKASKTECGGGQVFIGSYTAEAADTATNLTLDTRKQGGLVTLAISGPSDRWFALGLGTPHFTMSDRPYTIVVDGQGSVQERKLGDHNPGTVLAPSIRVASNTVTDGVRTVVLTREFAGRTPDHFTFNPSVSTVPVLTASGSGPAFSYHGPKTR